MGKKAAKRKVNGAAVAHESNPYLTIYQSKWSVTGRGWGYAPNTR